jgi:hypothetical protein
VEHRAQISTPVRKPLWRNLHEQLQRIIHAKRSWGLGKPLHHRFEHHRYERCLVEGKAPLRWTYFVAIDKEKFGSRVNHGYEITLASATSAREP